MDITILQAIIKITEQREIESLDHSLVTVLAENFSLLSVSIYKFENEDLNAELKRTITLSVHDGAENKVKYHYESKPEIVSCKEHLHACFSGQKQGIYQQRVNNKIVTACPLTCDDKVIGAVEMISHETLDNVNALVECFIQVYENCLFLINKSERDKLTGLLNRHSFDTKFQRLVKTQYNKQRLAFENNTQNEHRKLSVDSYAWLAMFDIDHFKKVNDQYGHVCGDEVLLKLSQNMKAFFRSSDLLFRFGGEEFMVVLEPIPYKMAQRTLERFRKNIEDSTFPLVRNITISGGYVRVSDADYAMEFIERADQAMYYAKKHGRNKICNYDDLVASGELVESRVTGDVQIFKVPLSIDPDDTANDPP